MTAQGTLIGVIGDLDPGNPTHRFTNEALGHAGVGHEWVPTDAIGADPETVLRRFAGLLIAPGSPYRDMEGAIAGIRYARERGVPLVGTWGGFQHAIVEIARHVLGIEDADHEEYAHPGPRRFVVTPLACSLVGQDQPVAIVPGTLAAQLYGVAQVIEPYYCNYGLNPEYRGRFERAGLATSGTGADGEVRIVELAEHPFFLATLFVPQARSAPGRPHPVIAGLAAASRSRAPR